MKKKKIHKSRKKLKTDFGIRDSLEVHTEIQQLKSRLSELLESYESSEERIQDLEIHVNLLTRLITTLCVEKFGMRIGVLKRLIKRIEKEAIRDSQIMHLESLYQLPAQNKKNQSPHSPSKSDPWEDIS